jgi:hypothetical protein
MEIMRKWLIVYLGEVGDWLAPLAQDSPQRKQVKSEPIFALI